MDELTRTRVQWDDWYEIIYYEATETWTARWKSTPDAAPMVALDSMSLRDMMRSDFAARNCPRGGFEGSLSERMST